MRPQIVAQNLHAAAGIKFCITHKSNRLIYRAFGYCHLGIIILENSIVLGIVMACKNPG